MREPQESGGGPEADDPEAGKTNYVAKETRNHSEPLTDRCSLTATSDSGVLIPLILVSSPLHNFLIPFTSFTSSTIDTISFIESQWPLSKTTEQGWFGFGLGWVGLSWVGLVPKEGTLRATNGTSRTGGQRGSEVTG
ncbi:hypothetical protein M0804_010870 [Polistes exclamans]|nr:hypothetical protein M0804_010870 [Polistes exclamans]